MDDSKTHAIVPPTSRTPRWRLIYWVSGVMVLLVIAGAAAGPIMSRVEQPEYKIEASEGAIEIRSYGPMIAAEAIVEGERTAAINEGFRIIAGYIFGANKPNTKIAMTAPVQQQKQTIAMTAPVIQQDAGPAWSVRFIMPKSWTKDALPIPSDPRVTLKPLPARRYVALTFSGIATNHAIEKRIDELRRYVANHKLATTGEPLLAFYNPPWTLPFFRRNEVMLELAG
jgi:hypothetical protein